MPEKICKKCKNEIKGKPCYLKTKVYCKDCFTKEKLKLNNPEAYREFIRRERSKQLIIDTRRNILKKCPCGQRFYTTNRARKYCSEYCKVKYSGINGYNKCPCGRQKLRKSKLCRKCYVKNLKKIPRDKKTGLFLKNVN